MNPQDIIAEYEYAAGAEYKVVADHLQSLLDDGADTALVKASLAELIEAAQHALDSLE